MADKEKIRAEVERLRHLHQLKYQQLDVSDYMCLVECGKRNLCNELLSFIDSLQEEPVREDLNKEIEIWQDYYAGKNNPIQRELIKQVARHFSQWQKEQLMAKAVDGTVRPDDGEIWFDFKLFNFEDGDKVKVIIIKEDKI